MFLHHYLTKLLGEHASYVWLLQSGIIFVVALVVHCFQRAVIKRLSLRLQKTHQVWDDTFLQALSMPVTVFIWFSALSVICSQVCLTLELNSFAESIDRVRFAGYVMLVVWFFWRYVEKIQKRLITPVWDEKNPADATSVSVFGRLAKICLFVLALLLLLQSWGIPLTGILAFGGAGALAVGIAAQDLIANLFGGLMIFLDKPFKIGDSIDLPSQNIQGTVVEIGWRLTKVMGFDRRPLYIPNSVFTKIAIINPQRMLNRRIQAVVGLRYDDAEKIENITRDIKEMLQANEGIDKEQSIMVHFVGFGASSLDINIYCFTTTTVWAEWRDLQQGVFLQVLSIVAKHGAEVAFPTRTLELPKGMALHEMRAGEK